MNSDSDFVPGETGPQVKKHPVESIGEEATRLFKTAEGACYESPALTLIHLRACAALLAKAVDAQLETPCRDGFYEILASSSFRNAVPLKVQIKLDAIRKAGNLAAHPEQFSLNEEKQNQLAAKALADMCECAAWFATGPCRWSVEQLLPFAMPPKDISDRVCGDAILRNIPEAQYHLGMRFKALGDLAEEKFRQVLKTQGVATDTGEASRYYEEAFHWFSMATSPWFDTNASRETAPKSPHPGALYEVAMAHLEGRGTPKNPQRVVGLLLRAAYMENIEAKYQIGLMYLLGGTQFGTDLDPDPLFALEYLVDAGKAEHPGALNALGKMYTDGLGVQPDMQMAVRYFRMAADMGFPLAQLNLARFYLEGGAVERRRGEARDLLESSFSSGIWESAVYLFDIYRSEGDTQKAFKVLSEAAENGDPDANFRLGKACREGDIVRKNYRAAINYLSLAAGVATSNQEVAKQVLEATLSELRDKVTGVVNKIVLGVAALGKEEAYAQVDHFVLLAMATLSGGQEKESSTFVGRLFGDKPKIGFSAMQHYAAFARAMSTHTAIPSETEAYIMSVLPGARLARPPAGNWYSVPVSPVEMAKSTIKIGRNDQCPCGSGKKYKRCCL